MSHTLGNAAYPIASSPWCKQSPPLYSFRVSNGDHNSVTIEPVARRARQRLSDFPFRVFCWETSVEVIFWFAAQLSALSSQLNGHLSVVAHPHSSSCLIVPIVRTTARSQPKARPPHRAVNVLHGRKQNRPGENTARRSCEPSTWLGSRAGTACVSPVSAPFFSG